MKHRLTRLTLLLYLVLLVGSPISGQAATPPVSSNSGGAACVVAKTQGNSLDIAWIIGAQSVADAIDQARQLLRERGFKQLFPQANSSQSHGWMVIVKTVYSNSRGRKRTSYGCGFSSLSAAAAENNALVDLQSYSWGWRPELGHQVVEKQHY